MKNTKKNICIIILIIAGLIGGIIYFYKNYKNKNKQSFEDVIEKNIDNMLFYDENNNIIDSQNIEKDEQDIAKQYIEPHNVVLELGARYGTVSCAINKLLNNKSNQVVIEPDEKVWNALEKNKNHNNCEFHIIKGFVSNKNFSLSNNDYSSSATESVESSIKSYKLEDIESQYNLKFDTLVVDCEGCLETFFDEYPHMYVQLKNITFEEDQSHKCNYEKINEVLRSMWKKI